jgi:quercetin dioxygenase-like cupin family protein
MLMSSAMASWENDLMSASQQVRVLRADDGSPELPIVEGEGAVRAIVWPGIGARLRSMQQLDLAAGSRTLPLKHPMEAVYYVMQGEGIVRDPENGSSNPLIEGSMIHIDPGTSYVFEAGSDGIGLLGGPCPADPSLYPRTGKARAR